ncbi:hypothetical protein PAXINDRAFT_24489, partial [Paxillus involutus ATCC 200175]
IENVLQALQVNAVTLWDVIGFIHSSREDFHKAAWGPIEENCKSLAAVLFKGERTKEAMLVAAFEAVTKVLSNEVLELTREDSGLQFGASTASASQLEDSFVRSLALKLKEIAPHLFPLLLQLLNANPATRRSYDKKTIDKMLQELENPESAGQQERDLGEIGGDTMAADDEAEHESECPHKRRRTTAGQRNTVVTLIRLVVCVCIMVLNTNCRCNLLQSIVGIFCHSTGTPARVIDMLSHAGLSISVSSIDNAIESLSNESSLAIRKSIQTLQTALAYDNFDIDFKTAQPTVEQPSTFVSATSATAIPLFGVSDQADLECAAEV